MQSNGKIKTIEELALLLEKYRSDDKRIILCHGVFDLLHIGHIRYLEQAGEMGDVLVVTVTPDRYVDKGPHRPAFTETLRAEAVASLNCVDYVAVNEWPTAEKTLQKLQPDVYVKGSDFKTSASDFTGKLALEEEAARNVGSEMAFTKDIVFSSTNLINRFLSSYSENVQQYLNVFRAIYACEDVLSLFNQMSSLRVLIIGDAILDDYHYCHTLGISSKDPAMALQYKSNDLFAGGALAIANHVANFAKKVRLVTVLGEKERHENFIRSKLHSKIDPYFAIKDNAPTTIKRRFVEGYSINKLFEIYIMDDSGLSVEKENLLCDMLEEEIAKHDLILAADFGHGAIGNRTRNLLIKKAPYLAVNTQANAGNRGFHTISKYSRADYVSLTEGEIRLEFRDMEGEIKPMIHSLADRLQSKYVAITTGNRGCFIRNQGEKLVEVPALAHKIVDRVGAGDTFFALTALAACLSASPELIGFVGNVVGGLAVGSLGNQKAIDRMNVEKFVTSLLK
jgi:rfaE bifunctional protein kinase chain/domain/rfaE bifunctional protein nucleotidyltransferase chain/domain